MQSIYITIAFVAIVACDASVIPPEYHDDSPQDAKAESISEEGKELSLSTTGKVDKIIGDAMAKMDQRLQDVLAVNDRLSSEIRELERSESEKPQDAFSQRTDMENMVSTEQENDENESDAFGQEEQETDYDEPVDGLSEFNNGEFGDDGYADDEFGDDEHADDDLGDEEYADDETENGEYGDGEIDEQHQVVEDADHQDGEYGDDEIDDQLQVVEDADHQDGEYGEGEIDDQFQVEEDDDEQVDEVADPLDFGLSGADDVQK